MDEEPTAQLEGRIQELLAGELAQAETAELLDLIAHDDEAHRILREMIDVQSACRRLFGCDVSDRELRTSLPEVMAALNAELRNAPASAERSTRTKEHG